ncbi:type IV pilin protein [Teredinibacter waterburyi]|jgi:prepilin-type N-terminal cleavage/methylation domain|uniref:type IV pilin protein n=1 Tax=Teredinibacter waterburyi TaxID=1500538 RepID=UPI00165F5B09|nr:type IV pilin protein [Teredinibacter waterburyi]
MYQREFNKTLPRASRSTENAGFTLVELLIATVIVGIIAAFAVPSYSGYVDRSKMRSAQADLIALSVNIENAYQRLLAYPVITASEDLAAKYSGWRPTSENFTYSAVSTATAYTLTATGVGNFSGCTISINQNNVRSTSSCKFGSGDWI